jgi:hypothetical protein
MECSEFVKIRKHTFHHFINDVFWHISRCYDGAYNPKGMHRRVVSAIDTATDYHNANRPMIFEMTLSEGGNRFSSLGL